MQNLFRLLLEMIPQNANQCETLRSGVTQRSREVICNQTRIILETTHFEIDGPGGELFNAIELHVHDFASYRVMWFYEEGQVSSFKAGQS